VIILLIPSGAVHLYQQQPAVTWHDFNGPRDRVVLLLRLSPKGWNLFSYVKICAECRTMHLMRSQWGKWGQICDKTEVPLTVLATFLKVLDVANIMFYIHTT
jgi:hypothetical protein